MSPTTHVLPSPAPWRHAILVFLTVMAGVLSAIVWLQRAEIRRLSQAPAHPAIVVHQASARSVALAGRRSAGSVSEPSPPFDENGGPSLLAVPREEKSRPAPATGLARLLDSPEFFQLLGLHRQAALDARFAALFRQLALDSGELATFKRLLVEKENVALDVVAVSETRSEGPLTDEALRTSVSSARAQVEAAIRASLGGERYAVYQEYERTLPQRAVVAQLEQRLSYSPAPLAPAQSEALVRILVMHAPAAPAAEPAGAGVVVGKPPPVVAPLAQPEPGGARVSNAVIAESQTVLTPAQVAALRDIQNEQMATARAMQLLRDSLPPTDRRIGAAMQILLQ